MDRQLRLQTIVNVAVSWINQDTIVPYKTHNYTNKGKFTNFLKKIDYILPHFHRFLLAVINWTLLLASTETGMSTWFRIVPSLVASKNRSE